MTKHWCMPSSEVVKSSTSSGSSHSSMRKVAWSARSMRSPYLVVPLPKISSTARPSGSASGELMFAMKQVAVRRYPPR